MKLNLQLGQALSVMKAGTRTVYLFNNNSHVIIDAMTGGVLVKYSNGDQISYRLTDPNSRINNFATEDHYTVAQIITHDGLTFNY